MSGKNTRITKINDEISREVAGIIRGEIKDPRLNTIISVTKTETTADLKQCKVYVSIMGDETQKTNSLTALKSASGYIRKQIAVKINLRHTPEFIFILDDSLDYSVKIDKIIRKINEKEEDQ